MHTDLHRSVGYVEGRPNVVVVGGGFGGVSCVRALRRSNANVILVDRMNHTLFQPLLYQLATGVLDDSAIASPLRQVFARQKNVSVLRASVDGFDVEKRCVRAGDSSLSPFSPSPSWYLPRVTPRMGAFLTALLSKMRTQSNPR
jgi:NADPH-dependent 2,4-dienoyl-CoA reductase/sulfur reductase-like enzyme